MQDGGFRVRGTVRDKNNEAKIAPLREAFGDLFNQLELFEADLMNEESLINAIAGSKYVVHIASPMFHSDDESGLVPPAINGTMAVMKACRAANVRRCVMTSSGLAVMLMAEADLPVDRVFNESHFSNPNRPGGIPAYPKSKVLAERAAWDFVAALPEAEKFELTVICPVFVMGPPLRKEPFSSGNFVKSMMDGSVPIIGSELKPVCDVRDVAKAHLLAIKNPIAANRRFIISSGSHNWQEFARQQRSAGWLITENLEAEKSVGTIYPQIDQSAAAELGMQYTDWKKTMTDMIDKMEELGHITKPTSGSQ